MPVFKLTVNIDDQVKWNAHKYATAHKMTLSEVVEKALVEYVGKKSEPKRNYVKK